MLTSQASLRSATKSLNKLKAARQEASNWSLLDLEIGTLARGSSKVFPTRLQTYDPHSFKNVNVTYGAPVTTSHHN